MDWIILLNQQFIHNYKLLFRNYQIRQDNHYNNSMQISKLIGIPKTGSTSSSRSYVTYIQVLVSLITGILLICITLINQHNVTHSELEIVYLFTFILIAKVIVPINYMCKSKPPKTHLQQQSAIKIKNLFIPSFIKSLLYFGLMMLILYLGWLLIVLPVVISLVGVEVLWCFVKNKKQEVRKASNENGQQKKKRKRDYFRCINIEQKIVQILIIIALIIHVQIFDLQHNIHTIILVCCTGTMCLLAFYYLHHQIFSLYNLDVDEIMAKQYPIQLFNGVLYCLIFVFSTYVQIDQIQQFFNAGHANFNSTMPFSSPYNSTNIESQKAEIQTKIFFFLHFPVQTIGAVLLSILYEYLCFEMIKNSSFKKLFLTQLTGIFWFNIFYFKEGISTQLYFSSFISFIAFILHTELIPFEKINKILRRCTQQFTKSKTHERKKLVQEKIQN